MLYTFWIVEDILLLFFYNNNIYFYNQCSLIFTHMFTIFKNVFGSIFKILEMFNFVSGFTYQWFSLDLLVLLRNAFPNQDYKNTVI